MERYLKDAEPQIKPEPLDSELEFDHSWIKTEFDGGLAIKHELLIKSEPSDIDDTDDDRLSLDDLNIWESGRHHGGPRSPGHLSSSSSASSIHSLDGDTPPFSPSIKLEPGTDNRQLSVKIATATDMSANHPPHQPLTPPSSPESGMLTIKSVLAIITQY